MLMGNRVILEPIHPDSIEQMRLWRNDPSLRQYFREYKDISVDKQNWWYANVGNNTDPTSVHFQIMSYKGTSKPVKYLIGYCGLIKIDFRVRSAEFSVYLGSGRGLGYGKEALTIMFDYGFRELNLHKIWCEVYDNNTSVNLYRMLGFRDEGVLRDNYFCNGRYGNSLILSVLENEWFDANPLEDGPAWKMDIEPT